MIKDPSESTHSREAGNRVSKYLLYAIGEIVLVVIGILIALQINNWNEARKVKLGVDDQLRSMVKDLHEDIGFFQSTIESDKRQVGFLRSLVVNNCDSQDLVNAAGRISLNSETREFGVAYQTLKERGELRLIEDVELRETMTTYFEETAVAYNKVCAWHKEFVTGNIEPYIMEHLPMDSSAKSNPVAVLGLMSEGEFRNIVNMQLRNYKQIDHYVAQALSDAQSLVELVNKDLKSADD